MVTRFSLIENQGSEAEVLRNGSGGPEGSEKEASAKSSMAYIQLERQKGGLNEALVRCAPSSPSATFDLSSAISLPNVAISGCSCNSTLLVSPNVLSCFASANSLLVDVKSACKDVSFAWSFNYLMDETSRTLVRHISVLVPPPRTTLVRTDWLLVVLLTASRFLFITFSPLEASFSRCDAPPKPIATSVVQLAHVTIL